MPSSPDVRLSTNSVPLQYPGGASAPAAVVLLHGRGATAQSIVPLAADLGRGDLPALAPQAPGGAWYPLSFLAPLGANEPALSAALEIVADVVRRAEAAGVPQSRLALVGFSQGACLALEAAARIGGRWGAVVAFSGALIGTGEADDRTATLRGPGGPFADKTFEYARPLGATPVFVGVSDVDPHIPLARAERTAEVLQRLEADLDFRVYPNAGHAILPDEIEAATALLAEL